MGDISSGVIEEVTFSGNENRNDIRFTSRKSIPGISIIESEQLGFDTYLSRPIDRYTMEILQPYVNFLIENSKLNEVQ